MVTSSFCLCVALVYINVYDAGFFVRGARQEVEGRGETCREQAKGSKCDLWLVPLHYIPIVIYLSSHVVSYEPPHDHQTYVHHHHHHCFSPSPWQRLPLPLYPLGPPPSCFGGCVVTCDPGRGGRKAAECQWDAAAMCEGRRGGSPDLSEWRRPAREMYTLPLLLLLLYSYIVTFLPISSSTEHTHSHARARGHDVDDFRLLE